MLELKEVKPSAPAPPFVDRGELLRLYERMVLIRQCELAAQAAYKKGAIPGFIHLYIGEEAVAVGVCAQLRSDDWVTSTHRGHGHALAKGMTPRALLAELFGKATGCGGGRGGSMHLYDPTCGLFGTNGIVGAGISSAVGAALSAKIRRTNGVAVAFFGDGATNHGSFHESLNFAAVQGAPIIFVCENNLYATATPLQSVTLNSDIAGRAALYGLPGVTVDGNDVLAVWAAARTAVARARAGRGPTLMEAKTYRIVGHHEGDPLVGTYRTQEELDQWKARCPIRRLRDYLIQQAGCPSRALQEVETRVAGQVAEALQFAEASAPPQPATIWTNVYGELPAPETVAVEPPVRTLTQTWLEAVRDGIAEEMRRDPRIIYLGEGTGERGGSFAHTKELWQEFGAERMIDTPICEAGFTGAALGAAATGCRAVADLMFAEFMFEAAGQIVLQAAKLRYMSNGQMSAPLVIRAGAGAIKSAGPHHSGTYHPIWAHVPGLIVVMPSNPADAKGLMKSALRANDPVIFLEPKNLFATKGPVPVGEHLVPFGQAAVIRNGTDLTLVSCGSLVHGCLEAAVELDRRGISCAVIDLRTLAPLDVATITDSLRRTGHLLVVDEGYPRYGVGAEIAAAMMEHGFDFLDAPIGRLHTEPVTHPFSPVLEKVVLISVAKIIAAAESVLAGKAPCQNRPAPKTGVGARLDSPSPLRETTPIHAQSSVGILRQPDSSPTAITPPSQGEPILMPHGDLTVAEATVLRWLKRTGENVQAGEALVEVETDKAMTEIESPVTGILDRILAPAKTTVKMGDTLGFVLPPQTGDHAP